MAEAVILSAIEKLDSWLLLKEADLRDDDDNEVLCSLQDEKADLCSVMVGVAELWKDNKEKLYSLLVVVADPLNYMNGRSLLLEIADLWEDHDSKENLHSLLLVMADSFISLDKMADLWKDSKGKLSKEKFCSWLAKKADLWDRNKLFRLLVRVADPWEHKREMKLHADILSCVKNNVQEVKNDLRDIMDFLSRVKKLEEGSSLHYFLSDVVEMTHDAQLLLGVLDSDPFILLNRFMIMQYREYPLDKLLEKMVPIQECLQETKKRVLEIGVESQINVGEELVGPTYSDVVGLEEDVELVLLLKNSTEDRGPSTTLIWGMGGIGKTTLARELYNHPAVVHQYERRAWVSLISRELSRKELLIKLIRQLVDDVMLMEKMDNKTLRQMLHQHLHGKQYFIVLDDVSENIYLKYVFQALPKNARSRLLFTTRSAYVKCKSYRDYDHKMENLDDDKSWQLLLKTAFLGTSDEEFPKQLEKRGKEMLRKCNGLPLAIKEVGRQWAEKRQSGSEWEQVLESSSDLDLSATLAALESTYLNLDPEAKSCFLGLAFFKEGTTIRENKLLQILTVGGLEVEKILHTLRILITESIIEAKKTIKIGSETTTYRINAVFQKLSMTKAEDEIGLEILRKDGNNRPSDTPRHRVIYCRREKFICDYSTNQNKHLVSLFFYGGGHSEFCPSYWNHFERLKILDMEGFGLKILPETVGQLAELRYLGLRNNYIQELPHSLGCLKKLEVLDIALNFMVEVADIIWEMKSLRHLYMSDISCRKPLKIHALMYLETLTYISVDSWTYEVSGSQMLFGLRRLGIEEVDERSDLSKLFASLAKLENLECLILRGFRFRSMPSLDELGILHNVRELKLKGRLTRLPAANNFPPKLWCLVLVNSCLDEDPMPILEKLFYLVFLILQNAYTGQQIVISPKGFPNLHGLLIRELWHLRNLQVGEGALRRLYQLEINSCPYLETLPEKIYRRLRKTLQQRSGNRASFPEC